MLPHGAGRREYRGAVDRQAHGRGRAPRTVRCCERCAAPAWQALVQRRCARAAGSVPRRGRLRDGWRALWLPHLLGAAGRVRARASSSRLDPADRPVYAEAEGLLTAEGGAPRFEGNATLARRSAAVKGDKSDAPSEPWRITARVKANAAAALFEQVEYQYGPDERALKLAGTAEAKFGARPRLDAVLSARQLDADKLLGECRRPETRRRVTQ